MGRVEQCLILRAFHYIAYNIFPSPINLNAFSHFTTEFLYFNINAISSWNSCINQTNLYKSSLIYGNVTEFQENKNEYQLT